MDPFAQNDPFATGEYASPAPPTQAMANFDPFGASKPTNPEPPTQPEGSSSAPASSFDPFGQGSNPAPSVNSPAPGSFDPFTSSSAPPPPPQTSSAPASQVVTHDPFSSEQQQSPAPPPAPPPPELPQQSPQQTSGSFSPFDAQQTQGAAGAVTNDPFDTNPPDPFGGVFDKKPAPDAADDHLEEFFGRSSSPAKKSASSTQDGSTTTSASLPAPEAEVSRLAAEADAPATLEELDIWGSPEAAHNDDEDEEEEEEDTGAAGEEDEDVVEVGLELQGATGETYEVTFPYETKLGMLLERFDEVDQSGGKSRERTLVKMVIDGGAADMRGVMVGSKIVALNDQRVLNKPYLETLEMVKNLPRPLILVMEKVGTFTDASQGICYIRKDMGYGAPSKLSSWAQQYFVIGGAVAKPNVLQLYDTKADYEEVVVNMFQNKSINHIPFKAYKLGLSFKCGPCTNKTYPGRKLVTYFWLKNPKSKTKVLKIGGDNGSVITGLRIQIAKHTSSG